MSTINIGIIIPYLQTSQLSYQLVSSINQTVTTSNRYNIVLFTEQISVPCVQPRCAIMNISRIWSFQGIMIATNIDNATLLSKSVSDTQKFFYVWDLEWLRQKNNFMNNMQVFRDPQMNLIARNQDHAKIIENYCNRSVSIILPNFNIGSFIQQIKE